MEKKFVDIEERGLDLFDEVSEAKMFHNEDTRAFPLREFGGGSYVQSKISFSSRRAK